MTLTGVTITDTKLSALSCTASPAGDAGGGRQPDLHRAPTLLTQADLDAGKVRNVASPTATRRRPSRRPRRRRLPPAPDLTLTKGGVLDMTVISPTNRADVGDVINYTLVAKNVGNVTLTGVTITDGKLPNLSCTPAQPATLAVGASLTCTGAYVLTQADLDAGKVRNVALADSDQTPPIETPKETPLTPAPALTLTKESVLDMTVISPTNRADVGDVIDYTLVAKNVGNVTLTGVTITDGKLPNLSCTPAQPATLAVGASLTCTGAYVLTQADLDAARCATWPSPTATRRRPSRRPRRRR